MSSGPRIKGAGSMENVGLVLKEGYRSGTGGIVPAGNIDAFPMGYFSWFYFLLASLLAPPDASLTTSLKAGRCECFLGNLALILPQAFLLSGGLMNGDLPKDNSSFARASMSLGIMGSFPLL